MRFVHNFIRFIKPKSFLSQLFSNRGNYKSNLPAYGRAEPEAVATDTSRGYCETGGEADAAWHSVLSREIKDADKAEFVGVRTRRVAMARGGPVAELFVLQYPEYHDRLVGDRLYC